MKYNSRVKKLLISIILLASERSLGKLGGKRIDIEKNNWNLLKADIDKWTSERPLGKLGGKIIGIY